MAKKKPRKSTWKRIGKALEPYPEWARALRGESGAYAIRDAETKAVLYVGESHSGRLYQTLTRHFQKWEGRTAGPVFDRARVQVSVTVTAAGDALAEQDRLICRLKPATNEKLPDCGSAPTEDVPF